MVSSCCPSGKLNINAASIGLSALLRKLKVKATAGTADLCGFLTWNDGKAYRLMSISSVIEPPEEDKTP